MGLWYKPQEFLKKFFCKKDHGAEQSHHSLHQSYPGAALRERCREKYGDEFVQMYDMLNDGIPIGNLEETMIFLAMVKEVEDGT